MSHSLLWLVLFVPVFCGCIVSLEAAEDEKERPRLRELGISVGVLPVGPTNSLTDVAGVSVGHCTLTEGEAVRTGVTAIRPHAGNVFLEKVPAAVYVANGFGKFVGSTQVEELGVLETPVLLTNTLSTFAVADALVAWTLEQEGCEDVQSVNPVVGECNDGYLNDIRGMRVSAREVRNALENTDVGPVDEGCVGAGTGVRCMGWKGGIGSASRRLPPQYGGYTIGVLVQTNFGGSLTVAGAPVGRELGRYFLKSSLERQEHGSCIVVVATDAPLEARRLKRLAKRATLGLAAAGSPISHGSGDYVLAFSTHAALRTPYRAGARSESQEVLRDDKLSPLFQAVREATEEAVINSMLKATSTQGVAGHSTDAIDPEKVVEVCRKYGVLASSQNAQVRLYGKQLDDEIRRRILGLEQKLGELMPAHRVPGVSVALIEDRELVWSAGFGGRCAGGDVAVFPDTVMEACSMSKPFFVYLFLKLVQEGRADLDTPLTEYLQEDYLTADARQHEITARMVMSHTTGLPNWRPGGWRSGHDLELEFQPGTEFGYSGEGFLMLQRVVEKLVDEPLAQWADRRLIQPLGMTNSSFVWKDELIIRSSCGHDQEGAVKAKRNYHTDANAAYTLYTTAEDYARFLVEILTADRDAAHSISATLRDSMFEAMSHRDDEDVDWGLGWGLRTEDGSKRVFHSGANGTGFRCYAEFRPTEGDGIVIMTNAVGGKALWETLMEDWYR